MREIEILLVKPFPEFDARAVEVAYVLVAGCLAAGCGKYRLLRFKRACGFSGPTAAAFVATAADAVVSLPVVWRPEVPGVARRHARIAPSIRFARCAAFVTKKARAFAIPPRRDALRDVWSPACLHEHAPACRIAKVALAKVALAFAMRARKCAIRKMIGCAAISTANALANSGAASRWLVVPLRLVVPLQLVVPLHLVVPLRLAAQARRANSLHGRRRDESSNREIRKCEIRQDGIAVRWL